MNGVTLVLGASSNPQRYSYLAIQKLEEKNLPVIGLGMNDGKISNTKVVKNWPKETAIDTISLYLSPARQATFYNNIIEAKPKRVIFNPGTENMELVNLLKEHGIPFENACTLVLLGTNQY